MSDAETPRLHFPAKVEEHLRRGERGRARELLASRLMQGGFDRDGLEQLGSVLLEMGDHAEAGRYLFLSGRRRDGYQAAIDLFLGRCRAASLGQFVSQWPAALRRTRVRDLPEEVVAELTARGMPRELRDRVSMEELRRARSPGSRRRVVALVAAIVGVGVILLLRSWLS